MIPGRHAVLLIGGISVTAAVCALAAVSKLRAARRQDDPAQRSLGLSLAAIAGSLLLFEPPVYRTVDRVSGVPNLAWLLGHLAVLAAALHARVFLLRLTGGRSVTWSRWLVLAATAAVMAAAFSAAAVPEGQPSAFTTGYARAAGVPLYWVAFLGYFTVTLAAVTRLAVRYARLSTSRAMRHGLYLVAVGVLLGLAFFDQWGLRLLLLRSGRQVPPGWDLAVRQLLVASNLLIVLGIALPSVVDGLALRRAYWHLAPLWTELAANVPELNLSSRGLPLRHRIAIRRPEQQLYRRVIDIRDAQLSLRPWADPAVGDTARRQAARAGRTPSARDDIGAAAMLAAAVDARAQHSGPPSAHPPAGFTVAGWVAPPDGELQRLVRLARAYRHVRTSGPPRTQSGSRHRPEAAA